MAPASSAAVGLAMPRPAMSFATCRAPYQQNDHVTTCSQSSSLVGQLPTQATLSESCARLLWNFQNWLAVPHAYVSGNAQCPLPAL